MKIRFVLDEWSWTDAVKSEANVLLNAICDFSDRLDKARERSEGVVKHVDYYEVEVSDGLKLFNVLFDLECPFQIDRDVKERLMSTLDRISVFDVSEVTEFDIEFEDQVRFAPGISWAHACCVKGHQVAVLPLPLPAIKGGRKPVAVGGVVDEIYFVVEDEEHVGFFRAVIDLERADEAIFAGLACSAFPELAWADGVWNGLSKLSRPYVSVRRELIRYLGGLNDNGSNCFHEYRIREPQRLAAVLSSKIGTQVSDENGRTKRHMRSREDRTRRHNGIEKVFWWHIKLLPDRDRIHFRYEERSSGRGQIVVGLFKDHCVLP